ncbi:MobA/MobL family protein [Kumtagia ephedrae]|uniref:MobA/MobL family protein n=1 Tax=Kumtagia ephedrae TaxID=2116701 RepID=UPI001402C6AA|nr:MobA/MobL family protein [Mesorhizobium ephedrae]
MTSLPSDAALYHAQAKIFKRSEGRSAVAAAAYRSASLLHDERTGQDFDYRAKHKVAAFIIAPENSPAWAHDRQELWNRSEAADRRKDAQIAREWEISIPRDIPRDQWESFAREVAAPFVAAGAIVDVAIHCPRAADGGEQPHIHMMVTLRAIDESTPSGFSKKKNAALESMHASGGRYGGGERGGRLKEQRERIAAVMNRYLEAAGSERRASHLSRVARGLDDDPEPTMGEQRKHAAAKRGSHDAVTSVVSRMRQTRILENELAKTEEAIMATNPKFQNLNGIAPRRKQDFKTKLFQERFPDADLSGFADQLHQVDTRNPRTTKIRMKDGGWIDVDAAGRTIKVYGPTGTADELAQRVVEADYADYIDRLEITQRLQKQGATPRKTVPAAEVETIADRWRSRGYTNISEAPDGVWVTIGNTRIQDLGDELRIHGKPTEAATRAMVEKAIDEWSSELEVFGTQEFKDAVWLDSARRGVTVYDKLTGELYQPSPDVRAKFEADRKRVAKESDDMDDLQANKKVSALLKSAAAGDAEAATRLENNDDKLYAFVSLHLDEDQRKSLAHEPDEKVIAALAHFRKRGAKALEDEEKKGEDKKVVSLSQRLAAKAEREKELEAGRGNAPAPQ